MTRNIKFNFDIINYIINQLYTTLKTEYGIIDNRTLSEIKDKLWNSLDEKNYPLKNLNLFKKNFNKKLSYFNDLLLNEILNNYPKVMEKEKIFRLIYEFIKKKGANYLTQHSLEILSNKFKYLSDFLF